MKTVPLSRSSPGFESGARFSLVRVCCGLGRSGLKLLKMTDDGQIACKAFSRLEARLLRLQWVHGIAAQGLRSGAMGIQLGVISSTPVTGAMRFELDMIVDEVNRRFGTSFSAVVTERTNHRP